MTSMQGTNHRELSHHLTVTKSYLWPM